MNRNTITTLNGHMENNRYMCGFRHAHADAKLKPRKECPFALGTQERNEYNLGYCDYREDVERRSYILANRK